VYNDDGQYMSIVSGFVYSHEVYYFLSANGAFFEIFAALDASSVMLAWHVHTVLVRVTADHTGVRVRLVTYQ